MHDVEGGDHIVLFRQPLGHVPVLEAHAVCHTGSLGVGRGLLDERSEVVVANVARLRVGLGELDQRLSLPTPHICYQRPAFQFGLHLWHSWQPHRH